MIPVARHAIPLVALLAVGLACGCATSDGSRPRRQTQSQFPTQPSDLKPERVLVANEPLEDRDLNGFVDTVRVIVYVFGDTNRYALPMTVDATFQFRMVGEQGQSLGVWAFAPRETSRAVFPTQPGPAYGFELNLNAVGTDRIPSQPARLSCEITLEDGTRVVSREPLELRVGGRIPK